MRKFIKNIAVLLLLFALSAALLVSFDFCVVGNQYLGNYQAAILDKVERMQSITQPKILLVGNSNVAFGFDSERIAAQTGMPVVNLGLHGGLGNTFQENLITLGVNEGDLVIVCSIAYDDDGIIPDPALAWITIEKHTELYRLITASNLLPMLRAYPNYMFNSLLLWAAGGVKNIPEENTSYSRSAFNQYGDINRRMDSHFRFSEGDITVPQISDDYISHLNQLNDYVRSQGAIMLIAGYPIGQTELTPPEAEYDAFEEELRSKLSFDVITHFTDYFIPEEYFLDTGYHLTDEGVQIRTQQLLSDLSAWQSH